jgi:hypothetical protein
MRFWSDFKYFRAFPEFIELRGFLEVEFELVKWSKIDSLSSFLTSALLYLSREFSLKSLFSNKI